ncbi:MAG: hypothetical protein OJK14_29975, partial [Achromobacter sp.]|uniref:hypothetical protein n=1 Tax=Achromobacter sp. TaxID=134375 RepID=UPI00258E9F6F
HAGNGGLDLAAAAPATAAPAAAAAADIKSIAAIAGAGAPLPGPVVIQRKSISAIVAGTASGPAIAPHGVAGGAALRHGGLSCR